MNGIRVLTACLLALSLFGCQSSQKPPPDRDLRPKGPVRESDRQMNSAMVQGYYNAQTNAGVIREQMLYPYHFVINGATFTELGDVWGKVRGANLLGIATEQPWRQLWETATPGTVQHHPADDVEDEVGGRIGPHGQAHTDIGGTQGLGIGSHSGEQGKGIKEGYECDGVGDRQRRRRQRGTWGGRNPRPVCGHEGAAYARR